MNEVLSGKTLIIGAGLGGLCLAHVLRKAGLDFEVYERDSSASVRSQGYRLHIDADGVHALVEALPRERYELFEATSMHPLPYTTIADTSLRVKRRVVFDEYSGTMHHRTTGVASHLNVNRSTLREILMIGLEGKIHFGESLQNYEVDSAGVTAHFANGREVRGTTLVGADGIRSVVRQQRAPDASTMDTGLRSIYGRVPIASARTLLPGYAIADAFTLAADARRFIMGLGPMVFPVAPQNAKDLAPDVSLHPQDDYVAFILAGRRELFPENLRSASPDELRQVSLELLASWPDSARVLASAGDVNSLFFIEMFTSIPTPLARSPRVTLLGDAIHSMSPSLGRGANVALRDAVLLGRQFVRAASGEVSLANALETYEAEMTRYGFDVVRQSVETGGRVLGQEPLPEGS